MAAAIMRGFASKSESTGDRLPIMIDKKWRARTKHDLMIEVWEHLVPVGDVGAHRVAPNDRADIVRSALHREVVDVWCPNVLVPESSGSSAAAS